MTRVITTALISKTPGRSSRNVFTLKFMLVPFSCICAVLIRYQAGPRIIGRVAGKIHRRVLIVLAADGRDWCRMRCSP